MPSDWILLRGLVREQRHWGDFPAIFARELGVRVHTIDIAGAGTQHRESCPRSVAGMAEDVRARWLTLRAELERTHGATRWGLLGVSLGGMIAMAWAAAHPADLQRVVLARALVNDPDLIFLDEPTTGLDPQARHQMWEKLRVLLRRGKTILLTTHFMDEAERLCDRVMIIDHGRSLAQGAPQALIAQHIEPEVVEVYGEGVETWFHETARPLSDRAELHGETAFCYLRDPGPVIASLEGRARLRFMHRRANLEDLFLKLTGREMRD